MVLRNWVSAVWQRISGGGGRAKGNSKRLRRRERRPSLAHYVIAPEDRVLLSGVTDNSGSGQHLVSGYEVSPTSDFVWSDKGNFNTSTTNSTSNTTSWSEGDVTYTATTADTTTTVLVGWFNSGTGEWSYYEEVTSVFVVSTSGSDGSTATDDGSFHYVFDAAGDAFISSFTYDADGSDNLNGSVSKSWGDAESGGDLTTTWTANADFHQTVTNTTDYAALFSVGSDDGDATFTSSYTGSGSYHYAIEGGDVTGSVSAGGSADESYVYSADYSCVMTQDGQRFWSVDGGAASVTQDGQDQITYAGSGSYSLSGGDEHSSWSYSGAIAESGSEQTAYSVAAELSLDSDGQWQLDSGNGEASGSGDSHWTNTGAGTYAYDFEGGDVSGVFSASAHEDTTYNFATESIVVAGDWVVTGTAASTLDGGSESDYSGSGSFAASGSSPSVDGGPSSAWSFTAAIAESGADAATYQSAATYTLDEDGEWQLASGEGSGTATGQTLVTTHGTGTYSYTFDGGSLSGTLAASSLDTTGYAFATESKYNVATGEWETTGFGDTTAAGSAQSSYIGSGTFADSGGSANSSWSYSGTINEHGADATAYDMAVHYELNADESAGENWVATTGVAHGSADGLAVFTVAGNGTFSETFDGGSLNGTFTFFQTDDSSYGFQTFSTYTPPPPADDDAADSGDGAGADDPADPVADEDNWTTTGTGSVSAGSAADSTYQATGTFSYSDSDETSSWSFSGVFSASGEDHAADNATIFFELNSDEAWEETGGIGQAQVSGLSDYDMVGTGAFSETFDGGSLSGTFNVESRSHADYQFQTTSTYSPNSSGADADEDGAADPGTWSTTGTGATALSGSDESDYSATGAFADSGDGWSFSATFSAHGQEQTAYDETMTFALAAGEDEDWRATGGNGTVTVAGDDHFELVGNGSFSQSFDGGSLSGTFHVESEEDSGYTFDVDSTFVPSSSSDSDSDGAWTSIGSGQIHTTGSDETDYTATGSFSAAGDGWTYTAALTASGGESSNYSFQLDLALDSTAEDSDWEVTSGSGVIDTTSHSAWLSQGNGTVTVPLEGGSFFGTFTDTQSENISSAFTINAVYDPGDDGGDWGLSGSGSVTVGTASQSSFSGIGTFSFAESGWYVGGTIQVTENDSSSFNLVTQYEMDADEQWQVVGGIGGASGSYVYAATTVTSGGWSSLYGYGGSASGTFQSNSSELETLSYGAVILYSDGWTAYGIANYSYQGSGTSSYNSAGSYTVAIPGGSEHGWFTESGQDQWQVTAVAVYTMTDFQWDLTFGSYTATASGQHDFHEEVNSAYSLGSGGGGGGGGSSSGGPGGPGGSVDQSPPSDSWTATGDSHSESTKHDDYTYNSSALNTRAGWTESGTTAQNSSSASSFVGHAHGTQTIAGVFSYSDATASWSDGFDFTRTTTWTKSNGETTATGVGQENFYHSESYAAINNGVASSSGYSTSTSNPLNNPGQILPDRLGLPSRLASNLCGAPIISGLLTRTFPPPETVPDGTADDGGDDDSDGEDDGSGSGSNAANESNEPNGDDDGTGEQEDDEPGALDLDAEERELISRAALRFGWSDAQKRAIELGSYAQLIENQIAEMHEQIRQLKKQRTENEKFPFSLLGTLYAPLYEREILILKELITKYEKELNRIRQAFADEHLDEVALYGGNLTGMEARNASGKGLCAAMRIARLLGWHGGHLIPTGDETLVVDVVLMAPALLKLGTRLLTRRAAVEVTEAAVVRNISVYYDDLAKQATRNGSSDKVVLGKILEDGVGYTKVANHYKATYFKLRNFRNLKKTLSREEIWEINKSFLKQQIAAGKKIILSHDPAKATGGFLLEVQYLEDLGYRFVKDGWVWKAVKK